MMNAWIEEEEEEEEDSCMDLRSEIHTGRGQPVRGTRS